MLPADIDDEQRVNVAHEHPNDLDSNPSSGTHTYFDSHRHSKSASHQRSHITTDGSRRSSHLLALLVSKEGEVRETKAALAVMTGRLEVETTRANDAERRALNYFQRLQFSTENCERAEQESARLREELRLYKQQFENAQKEIFRAQDIIDQVASQRNQAEAEAERAKTKARKLQEEKLVKFTLEKGRRMGYQEGLSMRRRMGHDEEHYDDGENLHELGEATSDEERNDPRLRPAPSTRPQPMRSESAPPVRTPETSLRAPPLPFPSRIVPVRVRTTSQEHRTPSPLRDLDEPGTIHPIPIRLSPIISRQPISVLIDDGWIQRADSRTSSIQVPPPHELRQPIPPSPSPVATEARDSRATQPLEPTPVPPPVLWRDRADHTSVSPPISRRHTPSIASRSSTHPSQYDVANKLPGSALKNEIYVGQARNESQPFKERNKHYDQDLHHSNRAGAENNAAVVGSSLLLTPSRSSTPSAVPRPHQPPSSQYEAQKIVMSPPPGESDAPRPRRRVPTESTAARLHLPPADLASRFVAHTGSEIVTPTRLGDVADPQPRRLVPPDSAARSHSSLADPMSRHARTQSEIPTPMSLRDVNDPPPRRRVPTESYAALSHSPADDPVSNGTF